jgi:hypothetical protein
MESLAAILQRIAAQSTGGLPASSTAGDLEPIQCNLCNDRGFLTRAGELVQCQCSRSAYEARLRTRVADLPS